MQVSFYATFEKKYDADFGNQTYVENDTYNFEKAADICNGKRS